MLAQALAAIGRYCNDHHRQLLPILKSLDVRPSNFCHAVSWPQGVANLGHGRAACLSLSLRLPEKLLEIDVRQV